MACLGEVRASRLERELRMMNFQMTQRAVSKGVRADELTCS
jgi:hypothetical protein